MTADTLHSFAATHNGVGYFVLTERCSLLKAIVSEINTIIINWHWQVILFINSEVISIIFSCLPLSDPQSPSVATTVFMLISILNQYFLMLVSPIYAVQ